MRAFKDIKRGDEIRWESGGLFTGSPLRSDWGKAQKLVKAKDGFVDVWMADWGGASIPVTPSSFRGFGGRKA
jgi:hypothetical protein